MYFISWNSMSVCVNLYVCMGVCMSVCITCIYVCMCLNVCIPIQWLSYVNVNVANMNFWGKNVNSTSYDSLKHACKFSIASLYRDFSAGLDKNYCRNPDGSDMPWCYTDLDNCLRDYCDVCNIGQLDIPFLCPSIVKGWSPPPLSL